MDRPILMEAAAEDLSPTAHLFMGITEVGSAAANLRNKVNLENLHWHCRQAREAWADRLMAAQGQAPEEQARTALLRATRGEKLAEAALAFVKVYDEVNADPATNAKRPG